ncbi:PAS domain S-box protein [Candidatus Thorarchaeota archaeon]|nr:MAG: PAS domain S-box protein [Candidatus Thorarchaeota archaeon]
MDSEFDHDNSLDIESLEDLLKHRVLIESLSEGFGVVDDKGILTYVNNIFSKMLGYSTEEMIGRPAQDFLDKENLAIQQEHLRNSKNWQASKYELEWTSKSGNLVPTLISSVPIIEKNGESHGAFAVITDLSAYKAAERKYKLLAEHSLQGLTVIQNDRYVYVNPSFAKMVGYSVDEILRMSPQEGWDLIHPEDKKYLLSIAEYRREGKPIPMPYEYRFIRRDESVRWVQAFSNAIVYEGEKAVQVLIIDITDQKEFEKNLRESEAKYRSLAEQSPQCIIILTEDQLFYYNPAFRNLVGFSDDELKQMSSNDIWDLVHPEDRSEVTIRMRDKIVGRPIAPHFEYRFVRKNGEIRWAESYTSRIDYGGVPAIQTVIVDITDRRQSERELRSAKDRALLYLDLMGHDLAQQLQVILNSSALMRGATDETRRDMFHEIITQAVKRCSRIIEEAKSTEQLLSGSLIERSLKQALDTCIAAMGTMSSVRFEKKMIAGEALILADEYLELLISNILMNAVEHNPKEHQQVWVKLEDTGSDYIVSICDDGPGMQDTTKAGIFDMTRRFGGLGLHTANHIAEKYHGHISIGDRIPGKHDEGLCVRIKLPKLLM